jgi:hypothetical protein
MRPHQFWGESLTKAREKDFIPVASMSFCYILRSQLGAFHQYLHLYSLPLPVSCGFSEPLGKRVARNLQLGNLQQEYPAGYEATLKPIFAYRRKYIR